MTAAFKRCNRAQDGSSNIDCGVSIGTIYGIYKRGEGCDANVDCVLRVRPAWLVSLLAELAGCLQFPCEPRHLLKCIQPAVMWLHMPCKATEVRDNVPVCGAVLYCPTIDTDQASLVCTCIALTEGNLMHIHCA